MHHHKQQLHRIKQASWRLRKSYREQNYEDEFIACTSQQHIHEPALVATRLQIEQVLLQLAPVSISTSSTTTITRRDSESFHQEFGEVQIGSSRRQQGKQRRRLRETQKKEEQGSRQGQIQIKGFFFHLLPFGSSSPSSPRVLSFLFLDGGWWRGREAGGGWIGSPG